MRRNVLFLCTANSARSIMAEAILDRLGSDRFQAFSAGSKPRGEPNPLALRLLESKGYETSMLRSKSWDEYSSAGGEQMHAVITVCDNARGESCPVWPGHPVQAHWGIPDPADEEGDGKPSAFAEAYRRLTERVEAMIALDEDMLDPKDWRDALTRIGRDGEGATGDA